MILLIDADIPVYQVAALSQDTFSWDDESRSEIVADLDEAKDDLDAYLQRILKLSGCDSMICALSSSDNFRYSVLPSYKHNRVDSVDPVLRQDLKVHVLEKYECRQKPHLEGDDVLGIMSTMYPGKYLMASTDKDLRQVPGTLFNWATGSVTHIGQEEGDLWFYTQVLTGDSTDGYKGCPGIGLRRAARILQEAEEVWLGRTPSDQMATQHRYLWDAVVKAYESKGLTADDALQQARVARILRVSEYDLHSRKHLLWTPPE